MIIIWRGFGFLVPLIALLSLAAAQIAFDYLLGENYYTMHDWPKISACAFTGLILMQFGTWINSPAERVLVDKETGEEVQLRSRHSLFLIPIEYWGAIVFLAGIVFAWPF